MKEIKSKANFLKQWTDVGRTVFPQKIPWSPDQVPMKVILSGNRFCTAHQASTKSYWMRHALKSTTSILIKTERRGDTQGRRPGEDTKRLVMLPQTRNSASKQHSETKRGESSSEPRGSRALPRPGFQTCNLQHSEHMLLSEAIPCMVPRYITSNISYSLETREFSTYRRGALLEINSIPKWLKVAPRECNSFPDIPVIWTHSFPIPTEAYKITDMKRKNFCSIPSTFFRSQIYGNLGKCMFGLGKRKSDYATSVRQSLLDKHSFTNGNVELKKKVHFRVSCFIPIIGLTVFP